MSQRGGRRAGKATCPHPLPRHRSALHPTPALRCHRKTLPPTATGASHHPPASILFLLSCLAPFSCCLRNHHGSIERLESELGSNHAGGTVPRTTSKGAIATDRVCTGCEQARRAQEGCRRWRSPQGRLRKEGRLREHQEERGRRVGSHPAQQDLQRGHKRESEEALREQGDLCACGPSSPSGTTTDLVADIHWPCAGIR